MLSGKSFSNKLKRDLGKGHKPLKLHNCEALTEWTGLEPCRYILIYQYLYSRFNLPRPNPEVQDGMGHIQQHQPLNRRSHNINTIYV